MFCIHSLKKLEEKKILLAIGKSKSDLIKIFNKSYKFDNKTRCYMLHDYTYSFIIIKSINLCMSNGMSTHAIFNQKDIIDSLYLNIKLVCKKLNITDDYAKYIKQFDNDIMACILCMLQGMTFKLYDKSTGTLKVDAQEERIEAKQLSQNPTHEEVFSYFNSFNQPKRKLFCINTHFILGMIVMTSFIDTNVYLDDYLLDITPEELENSVLTAVRNNQNKLIITTN